MARWPLTKRVIALSLAATTLASAQAAADRPQQPHETILSAIRTHVEENAGTHHPNHEIEVAVLDQRLKLPLCDHPLEVFSPPGSRDLGAISVGVRCGGTQPWTIYHRAFLRVYQDVAVLSHAVTSGAILTTEDVAATRKDLGQLHGSTLSPQQAIGKQIRKSLPAGTVLNSSHLTGIKLIKRGQKVAIKAGNPQFEVNMSGEALMDGELGQRIRVRNEVSRRVVEGIVSGAGQINVTP